MRNWGLELPPSQTLRFSHTGERETRKTREWLLTKRKGPWPVFSFPPSFARKFSSRERCLGMRQGLEQAKISKYSMRSSLFCLRSSFSQSPSRADKIIRYLRFLCPSYSYMDIPFLQKALQWWYPGSSLDVKGAVTKFSQIRLLQNARLIKRNIKITT